MLSYSVVTRYNISNEKRGAERSRARCLRARKIRDVNIWAEFRSAYAHGDATNAVLPYLVKRRRRFSRLPALARTYENIDTVSGIRREKGGPPLP